MPQDEFVLLLQACDVFDLVRLDAGFVAAVKPELMKDPVIGEDIIARIREGWPRMKSAGLSTRSTPRAFTISGSSSAASGAPTTSTRTCLPTSCSKTLSRKPPPSSRCCTA
jgi:hypothetical protein